MNGEWYPGHFAELSSAVENLRAEDPEYDKAWKDGLQQMSDRWDAECFNVYMRARPEELASPRDRFFALLNMEQGHE